MNKFENWLIGVILVLQVAILVLMSLTFANTMNLYNNMKNPNTEDDKAFLMCSLYGMDSPEASIFTDAKVIGGQTYCVTIYNGNSYTVLLDNVIKHSANPNAQMPTAVP